MTKVLRCCMVLFVGLCASSCSGTDHRKAQAEILNSRGGRVGFAILEQTSGGVRVNLRLAGLPIGDYGFRFHNFGACDAPHFINAGRPFPAAAESAELSQVTIDSTGTGAAEIVTGRVTLGEDEHSLFHPGGTSLVVHALPAGSAAAWDGERVACGIVVPFGEDEIVETLPAGVGQDANTPRNMGTPDKNFRRPE